MRRSGAEDQPVVEAKPPFGDPLPAARIRIDGRNHAFGFDDKGNLIGDPAAFLKAIANARRADIMATDGGVIGTLAITGASASLRWMDDQQKRVGTVTAIVASGPLSVAAIPLPPTLPRITQPPASDLPPRRLSAADVTAIRKVSHYCDGNVPPDGAVTSYRLDARHTVGIVSCFLGAYQGPSVIVIIGEDGRWAPASIERPDAFREGAESQWQHLLTTADYLSEDRLLSEWAKGRGLGDCGHSGTWTWDGEMFRLASYRALDDCRGARLRDWPSLWQTANDPVEFLE